MIQAVNADGSTSDIRPVGKLSLWQLNNLKLDGTLRIGLPLAAWFLWKRSRPAAIACASAAAVLWANRNTGINL